MCAFAKRSETMRILIKFTRASRLAPLNMRRFSRTTFARSAVRTAHYTHTRKVRAHVTRMRRTLTECVRVCRVKQL